MNVDPIKLLQERASLRGKHAAETAVAEISDVPYEIPLEPSAGVQVMRLTIASTYRSPIPVLYDPVGRVTFPITNRD